MNKAEFVAAIAERCDVSKATVLRVLDAARDVSDKELTNGGTIMLKGWMVMKTVPTKERTVTNLKTGGATIIPAGRRPKITALKGFGR